MSFNRYLITRVCVCVCERNLGYCLTNISELACLYVFVFTIYCYVAENELFLTVWDLEDRQKEKDRWRERLMRKTRKKKTRMCKIFST